MARSHWKPNSISMISARAIKQYWAHIYRLNFFICCLRDTVQSIFFFKKKAKPLESEDKIAHAIEDNKELKKKLKENTPEAKQEIKDNENIIMSFIVGFINNIFKQVNF